MNLLNKMYHVECTINSRSQGDNAFDKTLIVPLPKVKQETKTQNSALILPRKEGEFFHVTLGLSLGDTISYEIM